MFLVGLPYFRAKAQDYFEALGGGIDHDLDEGGSSRQQRILSEPVRRTQLPSVQTGLTGL